MIISTGGGTLESVQRAYDELMPINSQLCFLQCMAAYPAEAEDMNLRVISTFREVFPDVVIGLSDHQNGIALSPVAYMLGARVIEKHFTLNRASKGTDHASSLEPTGLRKMIRDLQRTRLAMGDGLKVPLPKEEKPLFKMGKMIAAARGIPADHVFCREDVTFKSLGDSLSPDRLAEVLGKTTARALVADDGIMLEDLR
jgi:sialic acid synthase